MWMIQWSNLQTSHHVKNGYERHMAKVLCFLLLRTWQCVVVIWYSLRLSTVLTTKLATNWANIKKKSLLNVINQAKSHKSEKKIYTVLCICILLFHNLHLQWFSNQSKQTPSSQHFIHTKAECRMFTGTAAGRSLKSQQKNKFLKNGERTLLLHSSWPGLTPVSFVLSTTLNCCRPIRALCIA